MHPPYVLEDDAAGQRCASQRSLSFVMKKGSARYEDNPQGKTIGRSVRLGDGVSDQDVNWAEYPELGSSPPSMEAGKALDAMGILLGQTVTTGDARGAYTQYLMHGTETWVTLLEGRWPKWW
mgnify:CR=1 FL=1